MPVSLTRWRVSSLMNAPPPVDSTCGPLVQQAGDHAPLAVAEMLLAELLEDLVDRHARRLLDLVVGIDEPQLEHVGQPPADGRFAAAHHADHHDGAVGERLADAAGEGAVVCHVSRRRRIG